MRKIFQFILAAGCAIIMTGCSGNTTADNAQNNAPLTESTPVTQNQENTEASATEATATEPTATDEPEITDEFVSTKETKAPSENKSKTSDSTKKSQNTDGEISLNKAKTIALSKAGLSEKDGQWDKAKRDIEDGQAVYELEFISGETEYDFEINAKNGNIIEYKKESVYD